MPKKLSENEREYIIKRLKEEAIQCLMTYGVKRTTVDELVKRVNIPKGTFYLFYDSKELLLFDAMNDIHNNVQEKMIKEIGELQKDLTVDRITDFLMSLYQEVSNSGLLLVLMGNEMELLMRKLPEHVVKEHQHQDDLSIEQLFSFIPHNEKKNKNAFSGAFRGVFMTLLYKREIGELIFDEAMRLMLRGLVIQMMEDNND